MQHQTTQSYNCFVADLFWGHVLHHGLSHSHHLRTHHDGQDLNGEMKKLVKLDMTYTLHVFGSAGCRCRQEEGQI